MTLKSPSRTQRKAEEERLKDLTFFESDAMKKGFSLIAGLDEAGRGPLAGPVVAAACIIPEGVFFQGINDSKLLTEKKRKELFQALISHPGVSHGIGFSTVEEIDEVNIHQATILAMRRALERLPCEPDYILVDGGVKFSYKMIPSQSIIKGDQKSQSIAGASILAKETRDDYMMEMDKKYPHYGFKDHKGYGTSEHLKALGLCGPCAIHRRSFEPVKVLLSTK